MRYRYLERPSASPEHLDSTLDLPYGVTAGAIVEAVNEVYAYLHALNDASVNAGYGRLEELIQPPANFSGFLSNVFVRAVAARTGSARPGLAVNRRHNGRPDLVPRALYEDDAVHRGAAGIEVKASRSERNYQGHNVESGWLMVLRFKIDDETEPVYEREPTTVVAVMLARLEDGDWNFAGRRPGSRRTPTASVSRSGLRKLRAGTIYGLPGA